MKKRICWWILLDREKVVHGLYASRTDALLDRPDGTYTLIRLSEDYRLLYPAKQPRPSRGGRKGGGKR